VAFDVRSSAEVLAGFGHDHGYPHLVGLAAVVLVDRGVAFALGGDHQSLQQLVGEVCSQRDHPSALSSSFGGVFTEIAQSGDVVLLVVAQVCASDNARHESYHAVSPLRTILVAREEPSVG